MAINKANDPLPILVGVGIVLLDAIKIEEHADRHLERDAMIAPVQFGLDWVPFEFHRPNLHGFAQFATSAIVGINHFISDTDAEIKAVQDYVRSLGAEAVLCKHWAHGSAGIEELAHKVVALAEGGTANFKPLYPDDMPLLGWA